MEKEIIVHSWEPIAAANHFKVYSTLFTKSTTQITIRRPQSRQDNRKDLINKKTRTETKPASMTVLKLLIFNYSWEREVFFPQSMSLQYVAAN